MQAYHSKGLRQLTKNTAPDNTIQKPIVFASKGPPTIKIYYNAIEREAICILHSLEQISHYYFFQRTKCNCYLAIAYIIIQLHIIHQRPRIMNVYHITSKEIQNNLICISRFHGIDILTLFQWRCQ